jgi:hypothetical protein
LEWIFNNIKYENISLFAVSNFRLIEAKILLTTKGTNRHENFRVGGVLIAVKGWLSANAG